MSTETTGGPEHNDVRLPLIKELLALGWSSNQIQWDPEWKVPKNPSEHSRREAGQKYAGFPVDIIIWESEARREDPEASLIIFETKRPSATEGRKQLESYLSLEYTTKMGFWTNGIETLAIYRLPSGGFSYKEGAAIPKPTDTFSIAGEVPLKYEDLREPAPQILRTKLERIFVVVSARDTVSTRSDQRLNQLCNLLLIKLASDQTAKRNPDATLIFQPMATEEETAQRIRHEFANLRKAYPVIFDSNNDNELRFNDHTIHEIAYELASIKLVDVTPKTISEAFQVFRSANLKSGEGQYFTPSRVIRSVVEIMDIKYEDRIIDPACGTGGFLVESFLSISRKYNNLSLAEHQKWAQDHIFGVDRDDINVKLTRAIMQIIGDGSANIEVGDSLRQHMWPTDYPHLSRTLRDEAYTCVITNPPFGRSLRMSAKDGRLSEFTITKKNSKDAHQELEVGLVFLERCYKLLVDNGRLGIILPETYWFSSTYRWLRNWLDGRFELRGMVNIPMEAFQSFCRAKTNFYILEKLPATNRYGHNGGSSAPRPSWFQTDKVVVSSAATCGISKDGIDRVIVGTQKDEVDDDLYDDVIAINNGRKTSTSCVVPLTEVIDTWRAVPTHFDSEPIKSFRRIRAKLWPNWSDITLGEMITNGWVIRRDGHGSPSKDHRVGQIPYIKVSDLRAGLVNINPTNMVSPEMAENYWKGKVSGLEAFDLISPERASSNIGEFCILMPGQEQVVVTREVIILRVTQEAPFDAFYLFWALSLKIVRNQWKRIIFMQTNREDVGHRYKEIIIPAPPSQKEADAVSESFRDYFVSMSQLRVNLATYLSDSDLHHLTLTGGEATNVGKKR